MLFVNSLSADVNTGKYPRYEWSDGKDVLVGENGVYIDTNKGLLRLDVVEYDKENDRYLIDNLNLWKAFSPKGSSCEYDGESR